MIPYALAPASTRSLTDYSPKLPTLNGNLDEYDYKKLRIDALCKINTLSDLYHKHHRISRFNAKLGLSLPLRTDSISRWIAYEKARYVEPDEFQPTINSYQIKFTIEIIDCIEYISSINFKQYSTKHDELKKIGLEIEQLFKIPLDLASLNSLQKRYLDIHILSSAMFEKSKKNKEDWEEITRLFIQASNGLVAELQDVLKKTH